MLRSNSKSLGNHVVSLEKERLQWDGFGEKEGGWSAVVSLSRQRCSSVAWLTVHGS